MKNEHPTVEEKWKEIDALVGEFTNLSVGEINKLPYDLLYKVVRKALTEVAAASRREEQTRAIWIAEHADEKALKLYNWQIERRNGFVEAQQIIRDALIQGEELQK